MTTTIEVELEHPRYEVTFNDDEVWQRCVNDLDGWRTQMFYDLDTIEKVAEMMAYNIGVHGRSLSRMDGWADMDDSAVTVREIP